MSVHWPRNAKKRSLLILPASLRVPFPPALLCWLPHHHRCPPKLSYPIRRHLIVKQPFPATAGWLLPTTGSDFPQHRAGQSAATEPRGLLGPSPPRWYDVRHGLAPSHCHLARVLGPARVRRTRPPSSSPPSWSFNPRPMVLRAMPVACATAASTPRPRAQTSHKLKANG